eukprot:TRINITY_DN15744_c0_g1_i1.p1 TRINITY_DN15744_c0_g1~~TRINITY_DN15744_c0_g1_i1.p1  ORF type:complete len:191 (+),score=32.26 TRINITY_DN15744_c0_g1_i1:36-608(+)
MEGVYVWDDKLNKEKIISIEQLNKDFDIKFTQNTIISKKITEKFEINKDTVEEWRKWRNKMKKIRSDRLILKFINEKIGFGVFALKDIRPDSFICRYGGKLKELNKITCKNNSNYEIQTCYDQYVIDGKKYRSIGGFINHSSNANVELSQFVYEGIPVCIFYSNKEIKEGTQLLFDYGFNYATNVFDEMN